MKIFFSFAHMTFKVVFCLNGTTHWKSYFRVSVRPLLHATLLALFNQAERYTRWPRAAVTTIINLAPLWPCCHWWTLVPRAAVVAHSVCSQPALKRGRNKPQKRFLVTCFFFFFWGATLHFVFYLLLLNPLLLFYSLNSWVALSAEFFMLTPHMWPNISNRCTLLHLPLLLWTPCFSVPHVHTFFFQKHSGLHFRQVK